MELFKLTPLPHWTVLSATSQTLFTNFAYAKDLNFVQGGGGMFMIVYHHRLAVNSIEKHVKKGRCPKTFWPGL